MQNIFLKPRSVPVNLGLAARSQHAAKDADTLKKIVLDLAEQLDRESSEKNKYAEMIRELLEAQRARKSEKLSAEQSGLFEELWRKVHPVEDSEDPCGCAAGIARGGGEKRARGGRWPARYTGTHRTRSAGAEKHCGCCGRDLRLIAEETSEPMNTSRVAQGGRGCAATLRLRMHRESGGKAGAPIEKSTAGRPSGAIIVAKWADISPAPAAADAGAHGVRAFEQIMACCASAPSICAKSLRRAAPASAAAGAGLMVGPFGHDDVRQKARSAVSSQSAAPAFPPLSRCIRRRTSPHILDHLERRRDVFIAFACFLRDQPQIRPQQPQCFSPPADRYDAFRVTCGQRPPRRAFLLRRHGRFRSASAVGSRIFHG